MDLLSDGLTLISADAELIRLKITTSGASFAAVADTRPRAPALAGRPGPDLAGLRTTAAQAGVQVEVQQISGGTRYAWHVPLDEPLSPSGADHYSPRITTTGQRA